MAETKINSDRLGGFQHFPRALYALLSARAYPHAVGRVELIETHISWVLLAGSFAYKIKRPVQYTFVDLRAPERRRLLCEEELRLNRRFAPELYVDVCQIVSVDGEARIGADGPVMEHAVRMRRFARANELDRLLDSWRIAPAELEAFGLELATVHARLPAAGETSPWGRAEDIRERIVRNLEECAQASVIFGRSDTVRALRGALEEFLARAMSWMATRRAAGRVRECHGDLHCRNVVRIGTHLVGFDCLEFDPALRWIDVADEIALLSIDLIARDRPVRAHAFLGGYLAESADYEACRVLKLYQAHRALVRAKVAALSAAGTQEKLQRSALRHENGRLIACVRTTLCTRDARPVLLLMSGLSGAGKTWLARQLAPRLFAVHLRSDVERKRRAGLEPREPSGSALAAGLYTLDKTRRVYDDLERAAEHVLAGGYTVIVDATLLRRAQRTRFVSLARRLNLPLRLVQCEAPIPVMRARLTARALGHRDASEADRAVLDWQIANLEALSPDEGLDTLRVESVDTDVLERILGFIREAT